MLNKLIALIILIVFPTQNLQTHKDQRCDYLVHIGDSLTLPSLSYIKDYYSRVGFPDAVVDASNGRSIIYSGDDSTMNGLEAVRHYQEALGDNICWVLALGTNDSAAVDQNRMLERFNSMMFVIGGQKVVWINVWSDSRSRPDYNSTDSQAWNSILMREKHKYSNMDVLDWAGTAKIHPEWFISDGIHYNSYGARQRSIWISMFSSISLLS